MISARNAYEKVEECFDHIDETNKLKFLNSVKMMKTPIFQIEELIDEEEWKSDSSNFAKNTCNPVRRMIEQMKIEPNPQLQMIALSIGDPTILSDLGKPDTVSNAIINCLKDKKYDGYTPSYGTEVARQTVANYCSRPDTLVYKFSDILLTNGCSHSLDLCIMALANQGQNILIPRPGFSIYKTLCGTLGIDVKYYTLQVFRYFLKFNFPAKFFLNFFYNVVPLNHFNLSFISCVFD